MEVVPRDEPSVTFKISVTDTGIGIPKDKQRLVFNQFETLDPSYTRRTDGTGLGLAICDKLVRAMGSVIELDSEPGRGSCFSFDLTFDLLEQPVVVPTSDEIATGAPKPASERLRILLAEDNPTNIYVATHLLTDAGHDVRHAANGREAVGLAASERFDVILMDISMPEMNGLEATAAIRAGATPNAATPIIALTAHAIIGDQDKFIGAKMNGYLTKPIRKAILIDALNSRGASTLAPDKKLKQHDRAANAIEKTIGMTVLAEFVNDRPIERSLKTLTIFIAELEKKLESLRGVIESEDVEGLQMLAHSTLGSGLMVGADRMVAFGRRIESRCVQDGIVDWTVAREFVIVITETIAAYSAIADKPSLLALAKPSAVAA